MRLFVAADLPDFVKEDLEAAVAALRPQLPGARWTRPEGRHLTLKFLGEVDEDRVSGIEAALEMASSQHGPTTSRLTKIGGFPNLRRPRVLWAGVADEAGVLADLANDVDRYVQPLGFEPETRRFTGHLTLARFTTTVPLPALPAVTFGRTAFDVGEIVLYRSQLRREGSVYTALRRFPLTG